MHDRVLIVSQALLDSQALLVSQALIISQASSDAINRIKEHLPFPAKIFSYPIDCTTQPPLSARLGISRLVSHLSDMNQCNQQDKKSVYINIETLSDLLIAPLAVLNKLRVCLTGYFSSHAASEAFIRMAGEKRFS